MKRIFSILLAAAFMMAIPAMSGSFELNAKTAHSKKSGKSGKKKSSASTIGTFKFSGGTCSLLSNGKVSSTDKCLTGEYTKENGGEYYHVSVWSKGGRYCGDGGCDLVIVGNDVYELFCGSENDFSQFKYNSADNTITKLNFDPEWDPESIGIKSATTPLSFFNKIGTVTWK